MPCCQHPASHSSTGNICIYRACSGTNTDPRFPWHVLPGTLELSWNRSYMFKAGSYIYLAPGSCLHIEETNCLTGRKLNQQSLLFHVACLFYIYLFEVFHGLLLQSTGDEHYIGATSKHQSPAFYATGLLRIKCRLRSGGLLCQGT